MEIIDDVSTKCARCDEVVHLDDVNLLTKSNNRTYAKPLCDDCLGSVGVPQGYELERDASYLKRNQAGD